VIYAIIKVMSKSKSFIVDQKVVYPSQGVGVIKSIVNKKFKDSKIPYYIIYLEVTDMTIMVPVDKAVELGIRPTVSRDEANKALDLLSEDYDPIPTDWKMRYQMNLDLLKKGSIRDIASIVRSLYHRSKVKELPIQERKLYDSAMRLLEDEVTISLKKTKEDIQSMIFARLEEE
jgi:CarD family transcriptional regulator